MRSPARGVGLVALVVGGWLTGGAVCAAVPAAAFRIDNSLPVALLTGQIAAPDPWSARSGRWFQADLANHFIGDSAGAERLRIDGETLRVGIGASGRLSRRGGGARSGIGARYWRGSVESVAHGGGALDGFIESFHSTFGFPDGGREQVPRDRLDIDWRDADSRRSLDQERLRGGTARAAVTRVGLVLDAHAGVTLPLAASDAFTAAAAPGVWVGASRAGRFGSRFQWGASAALSWRGGRGLAGSQPFGLAARGVLQMEITPWLAGRAQLDVASPLADSDIDTLGQANAQLGLGLVAGTSRWQLEGVVVEDIVVDSASDVILQLRLERRL